MKFKRNQVTNDLVFTRTNGRAKAILATILVKVHETKLIFGVHWMKSIFKIRRKIDKNNAYVEFERDLVTNHD